MAKVECEWRSIKTSGEGPTARHGHAVAACGNDIYLFGGSSSDQGSGTIVFHNDFYKLSVSVRHGRSEWKQLDNCGKTPCPREGHSLSFHENQLYVYGGRNRLDARTCLPGLYVYDIGTQRWNYKLTLGPAPGSLSPSTDCIGSMLFVIGGYLQSEVSNAVYMLHLESLQWSLLAASGGPPSPRCDHASAVIGGKIYICGGSGGDDIWYNDLHILDTETLTWAQLNIEGEALIGRGGHILIPNYKDLYVFGGYNDSLETSSNALDGLKATSHENGKWRDPVMKGETPVTCYGHTGTLLNDKVYIIGGITQNGEMCSISILKFFQTGKKSVSVQTEGAAPSLENCVRKGPNETSNKEESRKTKQPRNEFSLKMKCPKPNGNPHANARISPSQTKSQQKSGTDFHGLRVRAHASLDEALEDLESQQLYINREQVELQQALLKFEKEKQANREQIHEQHQGMYHDMNKFMHDLLKQRQKDYEKRTKKIHKEQVKLKMEKQYLLAMTDEMSHQA